MFLVGIISWWYGNGFKDRFKRIFYRLKNSVDFFSFRQIFLTLFDPFRQISANEVDGAVGVKIQSFFDRLLSRIIGFIMRIFMVLFGIIAIVFQIVFSFLVALLWLVIPTLPFVGFILMILGIKF